MLKFLKDLFKKEEEKIEVNFLDLNSWLDSSYYNTVNHTLARISEIKDRLGATAQHLQKKDVSNEKVEEKLKTVVKGNKESFVKALHSLLMKLHTPERLDKKTLQQYTDSCVKELQDFHARTVKNFYVMKHLIGEEADAVTANLRELHSVVLSLKGLADKSQIAEEVRAKLVEINEHLDESSERRKRIRILEEQRFKFLEKERELKDKIHKLKEGRHFAELERLKLGKEALLKLDLDLKNEVENLFSPVKKALKKSSFAKEKPAVRYLEHTYQALEEDKDLEIVVLLDRLREAVQKGVVDVKLKGKVEETLSSLTQEKLSGLKEKIRQLRKKLAELDHNLGKNNFQKVQDKFVRELQELESAWGDVNQELEKLLSFELKTDIKYLNKLISQLAGSEVIIKNAPLG